MSIALYILGFIKPVKTLCSSFKNKKITGASKTCYFDTRRLWILTLLAMAIMLLGVWWIGNIFNRYFILAKTI